jgi:hypothetical protein
MQNGRLIRTLVYGVPLSGSIGGGRQDLIAGGSIVGG